MSGFISNPVANGFSTGPATSVTNLSTLSVTGFTDGFVCYVQSVEAPWYFVLNGSSLTVDGITIANTALGGNTRWVRDLGYNSPVWSVQSTWHINAITGNDENDGSVSPIKTLGELKRRWGSNVFLGQDTTVNIDSNLPESDPLDANITLGEGNIVKFIGTTLTIVQSGTLQAGLVAFSPATNTEYMVVGNTAIDGQVSNRIQLTSGNIGFHAWIQRGNGASQAFTSNFCKPGGASFFNLQVLGPAVGNTYNVVTLPQMFIRNITLNGNALNVGFTQASQIILQDLNFVADPQGFTPTVNAVGKNNDATIKFLGCRFDCGLVARGSLSTVASSVDFQGCEFTAGCQVGSGMVIFEAGMLQGGSFLDLIVLPGAHAIFLNDFATYGGGISMYPASSAEIIALASHRTVATNRYPRNVDGSGIYIGAGAVVTANNLGGPRRVWGAGNAGYGIHVEPGAYFCPDAVSALTITGTKGDFGLAGDTVSNIPIAYPWVNSMQGYADTSITCSWTNFSTAVASGGFGGSAFNPARNCGVLKINTALTTQPAAEKQANGNFTFDVQSIAMCDVTSGGFTVTMPPAATQNLAKRRTVTNSNGDASVLANNITVSGNGINIESYSTPGTFAASAIINVKGGSGTWYLDTTNSHWKLIAKI